MTPLLDKVQLAELLNVDVSWVEKATAARELPITWIGRYARYDLVDITAWLASKKEPPASLRLVTGPRPPAGPHTPTPPPGPATPSKQLGAA